MSEPEFVATDDTVPDGTQLPLGGEEIVEEGDAGVNDTGDEPWYQEGDD
jgi:hypothetical protein